MQRTFHVFEFENSLIEVCLDDGEIRTPMFEHYEVISRSVGDTTDIVTKEMYDFHDKGDRHITLRPEGTAGWTTWPSSCPG